MRNTLAIARKELAIYFTTPWAYAGLHGDGLHLVLLLHGLAGTLHDVQQPARRSRLGAASRRATAYKNLTDGVVVAASGARS